MCIYNHNTPKNADTCFCCRMLNRSDWKKRCRREEKGVITLLTTEVSSVISLVVFSRSFYGLLFGQTKHDNGHAD